MTVTIRIITILLATSLLYWASYLYADNSQAQQFLHTGCISSPLDHSDTEDVLQNILAEGDTVLTKRKDFLRQHFDEKPNDTLYEIKQKPIDRILKVDNNGIRYYAIYNHLLGTGSYSQVLLAQDINTKELLAVKVQPYTNPEDIQHEIKHLAIINEYKGDTLIKTQNGEMHYLFCTFNKGISADKLHLDNSNLNEQDILNIISSSFIALNSLHKQYMVHNDIHEGNLIYNPSQNKSHWVDMAFSLKLMPGTESRKVKLDKNQKPPCYKAPESNFERGYATDIYQLGFMSLRLLLVLTENDQDLRKKYVDSKADSFEAIHKKYKSLSLASSPKSKAYSLLFKMMSPTKAERPTLDAAINEMQLVRDNEIVCPANQINFKE
jgi:serine/threonine protein kinase